MAFCGRKTWNSKKEGSFGHGSSGLCGPFGSRWREQFTRVERWAQPDGTEIDRASRRPGGCSEQSGARGSQFRTSGLEEFRSGPSATAGQLATEEVNQVVDGSV